MAVSIPFRMSASQNTQSLDPHLRREASKTRRHWSDPNEVRNSAALISGVIFKFHRPAIKPGSIAFTALLQ
jgi:hypothetical protein